LYLLVRPDCAGHVCACGRGDGVDVDVVFGAFARGGFGEAYDAGFLDFE